MADRPHPLLLAAIAAQNSPYKVRGNIPLELKPDGEANEVFLVRGSIPLELRPDGSNIIGPFPVRGEIPISLNPQGIAGSTPINISGSVPIPSIAPRGRVLDSSSEPPPGSFTASDYPGLTADFASDSGITLDGSSRISTWTKVEGTANDLTQATAGNRPYIQANVFNSSVQAVSVETQTQTLRGGSGSQYYTSTAFTIYCVVTLRAIATNNTTAFNNDAIWGDAQGFLGLFARNTSPPRLVAQNFDSNSDIIEHNIALDTPYIICVYRNATTMFMEVNGVAVGSIATGGTTLRDAGIGNPYLGQKTAQCDIGRLTYYNQTHGSSDRASVFADLNSIYNVY